METKTQPPNEPTRKDEIKDIENAVRKNLEAKKETNMGKLLDIFFIVLSKLYNLAEEIEMDSLPDQETSDPGIRKLEGEKLEVLFYDKKKNSL